jgi:uncharacterized protein YdhG (YjbR/CyaY superfamily)
MEASKSTFTNIDEYIANFPAEIQGLLQKVRNTIAAEAPLATEAISYQLPTFKLQGNLVHFAAFKHHIGFYPGAAGIANFEQDLKPYKWAKGSVQFPLDQPIPYDLIAKITKFRVGQNMELAAKKSKSK